MAKSLTVVIPVYNEEIDLPKNIPVLYSFMSSYFRKYDWEIVIADNASSDNTKLISLDLSKKANVRYVRLDQKGRGRALKKVWDESKSDFLSYMDVDLSSDLSYFPKLIKYLEEGDDIAIGSRLLSNSKVIGRPFIREITSRGYSTLFRIVFGTSFKDAQCGFKAIKKDCWQKISPFVEDVGWFFDTEFLIIADKAEFNIKEVAIRWEDNPDSTVKILKTAGADINGLIRLFKEKPWIKLK